ncbi:hypothetical protein [Gloeocapsa sp. PCC 73106]|uniref:hypothetical protein n=1 Tax=Gloeocapsa sp. PCC 73106 TaxID=102232 RepID=UPI0002ABEBE6|nr:hypothetical protein [Gloeocapsa sp. PCC 73106]ELR97573.1 hypothetical protein GLO73106DRAFT_00013830 [Gloeocapsa sp. PCC 73106]
MNVNFVLDKEWEDKSLKEIVEAPIEALQGITPESASKLAEALGIKNSIRALADCKYVAWAQALTILATQEE